MSKINAVRSEMQTKFDNDMIAFKKEITERLEAEIATAVQNCVKIALEGINATMNQILSANSTIVYDNMKSEREIISNATAAAVARKVHIAVTSAVARAMQGMQHLPHKALPAPAKNQNVCVPTMTLSSKTGKAQSSRHEAPGPINPIVDGIIPNQPRTSSSSTNSKSHCQHTSYGSPNPHVTVIPPPYDPMIHSTPSSYARLSDEVGYGDSPKTIHESTTRFVFNNPNGVTQDGSYDHLYEYLLD
jgi:hypothetical protein